MAKREKDVVFCVGLHVKRSAATQGRFEESEHQCLSELYAERYPSSNLEQTNRFGENMIEDNERGHRQNPVV